MRFQYTLHDDTYVRTNVNNPAPYFTSQHKIGGKGP